MSDEGRDTGVRMQDMSGAGGGTQGTGGAARDARPGARGTDPEDARSFSEAAVKMLRTAKEEAVWLLERGYPASAVITLVGGHHRLTARQRLALRRASNTAAQCEARKARLLPAAALSQGTLQIDGFNTIITLEVALSGGILLLCPDGTIRDLAGLRGTYHPIDKTDKALDMIGAAMDTLKIPAVTFWLDSPVSNSGRLKVKILKASENWGIPVSVELAANPDTALAHMERVVTSDSVILDSCPSWFNLAPFIISSCIPSARVLEF